MDLDKIPLMSAITKRMGWLNRKQRVISQNIANADTPNYQAKELQPQDFRGLLDKAPTRGSSKSSVRLATTNAAHMTPGGGRTSQAGVEKSEAYEASPSGNNVVLEEQMLNMANTQLEYGTMINLYRKQVSMLRISLGKTKN